MRFRPEDQYCKPAVARSNKTSCLVLKVKRKWRSKVEGNGVIGREEGTGDQSSQSNERCQGKECEGVNEEYDYTAELIGVVNTMFQFPGITCIVYSTYHNNNVLQYEHFDE